MRFLLPIILVACFFTERDCQAQDFQLVEPTGVITANISFGNGRMIVNDANGSQYVFYRNPTFDSYDRRYTGYLHPALNRVVRFPRSGRGLMQVTDLDDVYPKYTYSRRSVRRLKHGGHNHNHHFGNGYAFIPPYFHSPYRYPAQHVHGFVYPTFGYLNFGTTLSVNSFGPASFHRFGRYYRPQLQSIVLDSRIVPRAPMQPVTLNLQNSAQREIRVTVSDRVKPSLSKRIRVLPGTSAPINVQRDAGADRVRHIQTYAPDGSVITREISSFIPPVARYQIAVHEWRLQSVAIDRTGKSPNVIEDTQFQGRGLGQFMLPPGDQIAGGSLDVVRAAMNSGNAGTLAPLLDDTNPSTSGRPVSSLEQMLLQQRQSRGR